ncbi:hybrid sensor histidine kinase/response regulator [Methylomonas sp. EFPC1]|uniref:ATP-binding response regulator n=1 Tax=unclassified Methylomonas TaxID=2608980 RepID=UPI00051BAD54|nr:MULTISPECIES: hybrid sensor histidine kinase/response regulator [unclassified Methylomonas]PKD42273.1 hybrid sensor histidine kinase/response regulator [Methylomonas sp. Kb3]QBC25775.1 hybrid sensor histidine kinase/response regulator [Methylomonas sp. LW13]QSB01696.1 hybrid sensor histidine kinase/response regulator [Methylomonas sp. EFPC1]
MQATLADSTDSKPLRFADISPAGQARLLDMTHNRLVYGITIIPFVGLPFVYWKHQLDQDVLGLLAWTVSYFLVVLAVRLQQRQYLRDRASLDPHAAVAHWLPIILRMALAHGLGLAALVLIIAGRVPFEYTLLLYMSLAAIMAANATHQSPVFSAFQRFFGAAWGGCTLLTPWAFPEHWHLIMPLCVSYVLSIHRHSSIAHGFFLQQIKLEEDSAKLAENYRRAKEEAEAALRAKNQFLTTASHDLRQPVHAMGFLIESISRRNQEPSLQPALQDLQQSVQSITQMFNSLLDLSRIELGAQPVNLQTVALDPLMNDVATLFREEARSRQIDLRVRLSGGRALVTADAMLLRQSMINLMQNALRYTQQGGVLMAARWRSACWQFEVWDTGVGIAEDDQQRIYSPFFRPEHAWRIDNAGHGLGLAVVARCADLMGASQGLSSREGRGSRFWLRLPAAAPSHERWAMAADQPVAPVEQAATLSGRCLVIDDEPQVRNAWQALLNSWGVETACAASANDALALLDAGFEPQAIFCDQRLRSGESGFELLQALLERCPDAAGAMVSGEFNSPALAQAEQEGYLVLHKPLDPVALHALLSRLLPAADNNYS